MKRAFMLALTIFYVVFFSMISIFSKKEWAIRKGILIFSSKCFLKETNLSLPSSSLQVSFFLFHFIFFGVSPCFKWSLWIHVCIDKHNKIKQPIFFSSWKVCVLIHFYFFNLFLFLFLQALKLQCKPIAHLQEKTF